LIRVSSPHELRSDLGEIGSQADDIKAIETGNAARLITRHEA
jgi:hypothetical protein